MKKYCKHKNWKPRLPPNSKDLSHHAKARLVGNVLQALKLAGFEVTCVRGPKNTRRHIALKVGICLPADYSTKHAMAQAIRIVTDHSLENGYKRPHLWFDFSFRPTEVSVRSSEAMSARL